MIKTKEFPFSKPIYLKILVKNSLKRSVWALVFLVAIVAYQATKGPSTTLLFISALPLIYLSYLMMRCWRHSNAKTHRLFFRERGFEIDEQTIRIVFKDEIPIEIRIAKIARVVKNNQYYLLFLDKKQFVYVPLTAFKTPGDMERFDFILKSRKRLHPNGPK